MIDQVRHSTPCRAVARRGRRAGLGAALALALFALVGSPSAARSQLVLEFSPTSPTPDGGTGNFDVFLLNPGPSSINVAGFQVELTVPGSSGVTFTAADTNTSPSTTPYIFGTYQSSPDPFSNTAFPNTDFIVSDVRFTSPGYTTVGAGASFGLEHVSYAVASNAAPGVVTVSFGSNTLLSDNANQPISFTPTSHPIIVTSAAVPEPSQILMAVFSGTLTVIVGLRSRRRRPSATPPAPTPN